MDYSENKFKILTEAECRDVLENELKCDRSEIELISFKIAPVTNPEAVGMLGEYFQLSVWAKIGANAQPEEFGYFIKSVPMSDPLHTKMVEELDIFSKEISLYTTLFKEMDGYKTSRWRPNCYYVRPGILVMEDLCKKNYSHLSQNACVPLDHMKIVLRSLASMHANSILYEERTGFNIGEKYDKILQEITVKYDCAWFRVGLRAIEAVAYTIPKFQKKEVRQFLSKEFKKYTDRMLEIAETSSKYRNVLCHRDLWVKNFFFKYDDENHLCPVDCLLVDFQIARYNPPAIDVLLLIYLNTSRKTRELHMNELLQIYYEYLRKELKSAGVKVEDQLTWDEFIKSCEYAKPLPLILNGIFAQLAWLPAGFLEDFRKRDSQGYDYCVSVDRKDFVFQRMEKCEIFKNRNLECAEEIMDFVMKDFSK